MPRLSGIEVVGIASPTCGGKTSLATEIQRRMPETTTTLSFDEYDLFPAGSEAMDRELIERNITNWEDPALFDMDKFALDIARIARGHKVRLQARSRESMAAGATRRVILPLKTNVVEGLFVLHDKRVRDQMGLNTFYIDIPPDVMVARRLATLRPGSEGNPWDDPAYISGPMVEGTRQYVLPQRDLAHVVVLDGQLPTAELADEVMQHLR